MTKKKKEVLFSSLAVLDPTVGHTTDVLLHLSRSSVILIDFSTGRTGRRRKTFQNTKKTEKTDGRSGKKQSKGTAWCSCGLTVAPTATCHSHRHIRRRHFHRESCCTRCGLRWYSHTDEWGYNSPALKSGLGSLLWSSWRVYHRKYVHLPPPTQHKSNLLQVSHTGWANFFLNIGDYLAKLDARAWLSHALCAPGQHTAERRRKCTRQSRSCLQLCQILKN